MSLFSKIKDKTLPVEVKASTAYNLQYSAEKPFFHYTSVIYQTFDNGGVWTVYNI